MARRQGGDLAFVGDAVGSAVGLGDLGIQIGVTGVDLSFVTQLPAGGQLKAIGALLTGVHQFGRIRRVAGFHIGALQAEQRRLQCQAIDCRAGPTRRGSRSWLFPPGQGPGSPCLAQTSRRRVGRKGSPRRNRTALDQAGRPDRLAGSR